MVQFLAQAVGGIVLGLLIAGLRVRTARRRRSDLGRGDAVRVGARLGVGAETLRGGRLVLSRTQIIWTRRWGSATVDLAGARLLSSAQAPGTYGANEFVRVRLRLSDGRQAQVQLPREDAATLAGLLENVLPTPEAVDAPGSRRRSGRSRRSWWAITCLVLGLGWMAANGIAALDGYSVQSQVSGGDGEGVCDVTWLDPTGGRHGGQVDCDDDRPGARMSIRVLGWPDSDDPWTVADLVAMVLTTSLPFIALGGGRLLYVRARRRALAAASESPQGHVDVVSALPALPPLSKEDLRGPAGESAAAMTARLAPYARRQVPDEGWETSRRPSGPSGAFAPMRIARALFGPLGALVVVAGLTMPLPYQWVLLHHTTTAVASATSTGDVVGKGLGPYPEQVTVRFRDGRGATELADVAVNHPLPKGTPATIEYAVERPGWARLTGPGDGLGTGAAIAAAGAALALLWAAGGVWRLGASARVVRLAARQMPRPAVGLLTADEEGLPVVLSAEPLVVPPRFFAVPLQTPLPHGTTTAFAHAAAPTLVVHGRLDDGEVVVIEAPGVAAPLLPRGRAAAVDDAALLDLLDSAGALGRSLDADARAVRQVAE